MSSKNIYKIINEEVSDFDFLGMGGNSDENIHNELLTSKDFQTKLITNIVNNIADRDIFKKISATYVNRDVDMHNDREEIDLELELTYLYNEKEYNLIIFISGDKDGDDVNYADFNVKLFSKAGDQIKIDWVEKNSKLFETFIETLVSPYL